MTPFRRLVSYFKPYKRTIIFGMVCVFMTNVFKLVTPNYVHQATDGLDAWRRAADAGDPVGQAAHAFSVENIDAMLLKYGVLIVLATLLQGIFLFTQRR